jgi:ubiquinone/menaquinone biosynthesis C-methylase UbiE
MFLRKAKQREPVTITMSGVRMGERLLQIGVDDAAVASAIAAKVGLSGSAAAVVADAEADARVRQGAADAGALIDVHTAPLGSLPFADAAFDVVVVHTVGGLLQSMTADARAAALRECRRVLRQGGRIVTIEAGTRSGVGSLLRSKPAVKSEHNGTGGTVAALEGAGFRPVRVVGDLEGFLFTEGLKT